MMKTKNTFFIVVFFIAASMLLVSCGQQKAKWKGTIEEQDGVIIVKNPAEPIYSNDVFRLEEDLTIDNVEEDEEFMFQDILHLAVDDDENIYVSDSKAAFIKVFDKSGNYLRTIGKKGQGPGEFLYPFEILIMPQGELMVNDLYQLRVHFFSLDGKFLRQLSSSTMTQFRRPRVDSEGHIIGGHVNVGDPIEAVLKKLDSDLNPVFTLATRPVVSKPPAIIEYFEVRRSTNLVWDVAVEDNIVWGVFNKYEIFVNNPEGKLIRKIVKEYDGIGINKEEEEKLIKAWFGNNPVPPQMTIKFPKVYPPFIRFTCDEEGRLFVQTYEKTEDEEEDYYDVFDSEGKYIVRTSLKYTPLVWKNKKLYMIEENEEGFQIVKRYKVTWDL
jgi:hypothetical protein